MTRTVKVGGRVWVRVGRRAFESECTDCGECSLWVEQYSRGDGLWHWARWLRHDTEYSDGGLRTSRAAMLAAIRASRNRR